MKSFYFGLRKTIPMGHCFEWANRYVMKHPEINVIVKHGKIYDGNSNKYIDHAWIEKDGLIYDYQTHVGLKRKQISIETFDEVYRPIDVTAYTIEEVHVNILKYGHHGPWG